MNAPLPLKVTRDAAFTAYDTVAGASNEVAGKLAQRLAAETQGEVLQAHLRNKRDVVLEQLRAANAPKRGNAP
jgi:hypothetical protein